MKIEFREKYSALSYRSPVENPHPTPLPMMQNHLSCLKGLKSEGSTSRKN